MAEFKGSLGDGNRIRLMELKRQKDLEDLQQQKNKIVQSNEIKVGQISQKFSTKSDSMEEKLKLETIGLVTFDDFKKKRERLEIEELARIQREKEAKERELALKNEKKRPRVVTNKLSFTLDDGEEGEGEGEGEEEERNSKKEREAEEKEREKEREKEKREREAEAEREKEKERERERAEAEAEAAAEAKRESEREGEKGVEGEGEKEGGKKSKKNPFVNTAFLPDREREEWERQQREKLIREYKVMEESHKGESITVTYSYWDGTGHRRSLELKKGMSIGHFLDLAKREFKEIRGLSSDQLMFVKEDIILPNHLSFYDLIKAKARGKSGPLFQFDVHEDVRLYADATKEKDETHAGKVIDRRWYEKNKHIFPASRWEIYDPNVKRETYTIRDTIMKH